MVIPFNDALRPDSERECVEKYITARHLKNVAIVGYGVDADVRSVAAWAMHLMENGLNVWQEDTRD